MARFRITIDRPPDEGEPLSFITLDLEPIEIRSVLYAATRMLDRPGWSVHVERLTNTP